jgi:N6-adenosine-specific RNA methylase IME4
MNERHTRVASTFAALVPPFNIVVADPPWTFSTWSQRNQEIGKGAVAQYALMTMSEIAALPVAELFGRDGFLFLWTTGWAMATMQAHDVARAWGFEPKTEAVWIKRTASGKVRVGTGYVARSMHEPLLICTKGKPGRLGFPSMFDGLAREHSRKPDEFYALLAKLTPNARRADLFSGGHVRPGFEGWGARHAKRADGNTMSEDKRCLQW